MNTLWEQNSVQTRVYFIVSPMKREISGGRMRHILHQRKRVRVFKFWIAKRFFISVDVSVTEFNISIQLVFITMRFFFDQRVPVVAENGADKFYSICRAVHCGRLLYAVNLHWNTRQSALYAGTSFYRRKPWKLLCCKKAELFQGSILEWNEIRNLCAKLHHIINWRLLSIDQSINQYSDDRKLCTGHQPMVQETCIEISLTRTAHLLASFAKYPFLKNPMLLLGSCNHLFSCYGFSCYSQDGTFAICCSFWI